MKTTYDTGGKIRRYIIEIEEKDSITEIVLIEKTLERLFAEIDLIQKLREAKNEN